MIIKPTNPNIYTTNSTKIEQKNNIKNTQEQKNNGIKLSNIPEDLKSALENIDIHNIEKSKITEIAGLLYQHDMISTEVSANIIINFSYQTVNGEKKDMNMNSYNGNDKVDIKKIFENRLTNILDYKNQDQNVKFATNIEKETIKAINMIDSMVKTIENGSVNEKA